MHSKVSFADQLKFSAKKSLENIKLPAISSNISLQGVDLTMIPATARVIFQPRYHQCELTDERGFVFSGTQTRPPPLTERRRPLERRNRQQQQQQCNVDELENTLHMLRQANTNTRSVLTPFRRHFKPLGVSDIGLIDRAAKFKLSFYSCPYSNPRPHQHRELDCFYGDSRLITRKTPDPFNIRFKTSTIKDNIVDIKCCHDDTLQKVIEDSHFITCKTPEPKYPPKLYFHKGRYSPAFTAHDAFIDRIAKSISQ